MKKTGSGKNSLLPATVEPLFHTAGEVAVMLRLSLRSFTELRKHAFYAPDGSRIIKAGRGNKALPLWSNELIDLFKHARREIMPGVRMFTDDEALKIRGAMIESTRQEYLALVEA